MSLRGSLIVARVECSKLVGQFTVRMVLATCIGSPFAFAAGMQVQSSVPSDTLFGRSVKESGFALALVVLGFAALWVFPVLASVVGGDLFSAEDRYGTWTAVLTRSRSRTEVFAGKVLTALGFTSIGVILLAVSSVAAGVLVVGAAPLINLSGVVLPPAQAFVHVALAWASVLPATLAFTALAVLLSVATRSSAAGIGVPVVAGLTMELYALVDGPAGVRRMLLTSGFEAWHGLLADPPFYQPLIQGTALSGACVVVCLTIAYRLLIGRDIGR